MAQVTLKQIEDLLDRKLDEKLDKRFIEFEAKIDKKFDDRFDDFETRLVKKFDRKFDYQFKAFAEHFDDKFDGMAEALQTTLEVITTTMARKDDVQDIRSDIRTVQIAVRDTNRELHTLHAQG